MLNAADPSDKSRVRYVSSNVLVRTGGAWQALSSHLPPVYAVTFEKRLN